MFFHTKRLLFNQRDINILLQSQNGPCPLIALVNTLMLMPVSTFGDSLRLFTNGKEIVDVEDLLQHLAALVTDDLAKNTASETDCELVLSILPRLVAGLDINPRFDGTFEASSELALFRAFDVPIVHGWVVDFENPSLQTKAMLEVGSFEASQALLIKAREEPHHTSSKELEQVPFVEAFLRSSSTQLTAEGIQFLTELLEVNSPAILFRNSHFATIMKTSHNGLLVLVTDFGILKEPVVWQSLMDVTGLRDAFYTATFEPVTMDFFNDNRQPVYSDMSLARQMQLEEDEKAAHDMQKSLNQTKGQCQKRKKEQEKCILC